MITSLAGRVREIGEAAGRVTPVPLIARGAVFLAGLVAIAVAYPGWVLVSRLGFLLLVAPLFPALLPRGRSTTVVVLLAVAGWLVSTAVDGGPVPLGRLLLLAGTLYLLHSLAALAAVLPYDVLATPEVITRWLGKALTVVVASAVLAVATLVMIGRTGDRTMLGAALLGLGIAVTVTAVLASLLRRP